MSTRRGERGQTSLEYLGAILVVAALALLITQAALGWGRQIVCTVSREIATLSGSDGGGCGGSSSRSTASRRPGAGDLRARRASPGARSPGRVPPGGRSRGTTPAPGRRAGLRSAGARPRSAARAAGVTNPPRAQQAKKKLSQLERREQYLYKYFVGKGLKPYQAAALVGNLEWESGGKLDPHAKQFGGGPGRGIAQWDVNDDRWQGVLALAKKMKLSPYTLRVQAAFVWKELKGPGPYAAALRALRKTKNVTDASDIIEMKYEVAGVPALPQRRRLSKKILREFGP